MKLLYCFSIILLGLFSCADKDSDADLTNVSIEIAPEILSVGYEDDSHEITVTANADWGVSSSQSWCKVYPSGGISGTTTLQLDFTENLADSARKVNLVFKSGTFRKEYTVTQLCLVKEAAITDVAFKQFCITNFDTDKDGKVSLGEVSRVTSLNVSGLGITSLDGIESFNSLQVLNCSNNSIQALNVSGLKALSNLNCSGNQLVELDIQANINLKSLDCTNNPLLTTIKVWTGFSEGTSFVKPAAASYAQPSMPTPVGYKLVWQDEFNTPRSTDGKAALPNTAEWWYETGGNGWGNNELQNYIPAVSGSDTCAKIDNGSLKIILKKAGSQVISTRMNTSKNWLYGYFEARLKLPVGKGTWPAFWMLPKNFQAWPDDGEIDIMEEVGYRPNYVSASIHCKAYYHSIGTQKTAERLVPTAQTEFHVYAVEWTPDYIIGYIDGVKYFEFANDHLNNKNTWPFNNPFYLKLNLAWGGNWGGAQGVDESALPCTYEVDYVRVFQKN